MDEKLNPSDEGPTMVAVGIEKGCVVIRFPDPTAWIGLPPQAACDLACSIIRRARELAQATDCQTLTLRIF